jgi:hypothetical protein
MPRTGFTFLLQSDSILNKAISAGRAETSSRPECRAELKNCLAARKVVFFSIVIVGLSPLLGRNELRPYI